MADFNATSDMAEYDPHAVPKPSRLARLAGVTGAMMSLSLVVGIGVWGYKLVARDVNGVPVVRAIEGPMREQPQHPGGRPAAHQGFAVNTVAAQGTAADPADRLMLAPKPVDLTDEDVPMKDLPPANSAAMMDMAAADQEERAQTVDAVVAQVVSDEPSEETPAPAATLAAAEVSLPQVEPAVARELTVAPAPSKPETAVPEPESAAASAVPEPAVLTGPGLPRSLRPQLRPTQAVLRTATPDPVPAVAKEEPVEADPDTLPKGTRLAQLGAYESAEVARSEWTRLNGEFGAYLQDKTRIVQKASSGGRTFYRLRAMGFDDLSDARRFCSALVAEGADCIPVTLK